jgi:tetratricopeptide (TPR) repeat protein
MRAMSQVRMQPRVLLVLLGLLIAISAPVLFGGAVQLRRAQEALDSGNSLPAGEHFESAARLMPWQPGLWERAALAYASADAWDRAMPLLKKAEGLGALTENGWDVYGYGYWRVSDFKEALRTWTAGLQQFPNESKFQARIALADMGLHDYVGERAALEVWLATGQGSAREHYELGKLQMISDAGSARRELAQAVAMDPSLAPAVQTLVASLDLSLRQPDRVRALVVVGRGYALVNEWFLALDAFKQATDAGAQDAQAWAWLGEAQQQTGGDGKLELDRALALSPGDPLVRALRGLYFKRHADYASALGEYRAAAAAEPENPEWQASLGEVYALSGDLVAALAAYEQATAQAPDNATYWRSLAMFCADNAVRVTDVGLPAARKAAALAPNDPNVLDALGWSFTQAGLLSNAEEALKKALAIAPDAALPHLHLAETDLRKGDQSAARGELNLAAKLDPDGAVGVTALRLLKQYFP